MSLPWWGRGMTREGDGYGEVVRPKGGEGRPRRIGKEMLAQKGDIYWGVLSLAGEASREILFRNSKLWTVDRHIEGLPSGCCPIIPYSGESGGIEGVKVAKHHLVCEVLSKSVKFGDVVQGGRRTPGGGIQTLMNASEDPPPAQGRPQLLELPPCRRQGVCHHQAPSRRQNGARTRV